jgi:glycosyltransferase involved in cell wall biosynthesis
MKNILISSYFPLGCTGYGTQTFYLIKYFKSMGINVSLLCWDLKLFHRFEPYTYSDIIKLCPSLLVHSNLEDIFMNVKFYSRENRKNYWKNIIFRAKQCNATSIFVFQDIICFEDIKVEKVCPIILWYPVHSFPLNNNELIQLKNFDKIYSISKYGREILKYYNIEATYIPHVISNIYFDDKKNKNLLRSKIGLSNETFVCLMVARNSEKEDRKAFVENITAFSEFLKINENSRLILHSHKYGIVEGINLMNIINRLKINKYVIFSDQKELNSLRFKSEYIRSLYTISDVLLSASKCEGFGIPIIESQMCNTPVITTNCTAMSENTFNGICTDGYKMGNRLDVGENCYISWSIPSVENIREGLEDIYNNRYKRNKLDDHFKYDSNLFNLFDII